MGLLAFKKESKKKNDKYKILVHKKKWTELEDLFLKESR